MCILINQHLYKSVLVNLPPYQGFHCNSLKRRQKSLGCTALSHQKQTKKRSLSNFCFRIPRFQEQVRFYRSLRNRMHFKLIISMSLHEVRSTVIGAPCWPPRYRLRPLPTLGGRWGVGPAAPPGWAVDGLVPATADL